MITYKTGNILEAETEAIVNTVNTVGVMGKGIALQFKKHFPENFKAYKKAVELNKVKTGQVFIFRNPLFESPKYIINFPTKQHWRNKSRINWIDEGLKDLRIKIEQLKIQSIAIPPLGCGQGGLNWNLVKPLILTHMKGLDIHVVVYEPSEQAKEQLKKEVDPGAAKLTEIRAMLLSLLYSYRRMGEEISEFASEKLCYFLSRLGETQLRMEFEEGHYGPYSGKARFLLREMNGYYIRGMEQMDNKPFEALELIPEHKSEMQRYLSDHLSDERKTRLDTISKLIDGFQTSYGMELLATVDYVRRKHRTKDIQEIQQNIASWSDRKAQLFEADHIKIALSHLEEFFEYRV